MEISIYKFKLNILHFASKKGVGSSKNGRDSKSKRLGCKLSDGQYTRSGGIIYRQRGTKMHSGINVIRGKDDTLFSTIDGYVKFEHINRHKKRVSVYKERK